MNLNKMGKYKRKQITFDLHTNKMQELGVSNNGYNKIRAELKHYGFEHLQGSVYVSSQGMSTRQVLGTIAAVGEKHPWLDDCLSKLSITTPSKNLDYVDAYQELRARAKAEASKQKETTQKETKQPTHADQVLWVLENCRERIAEDIAANRNRQVGQVQQVQQVRQVGQGKSAAARKTRSK